MVDLTSLTQNKITIGGIAIPVIALIGVGVFLFLRRRRGRKTVISIG